jgi:hypothetical protein
VNPFAVVTLAIIALTAITAAMAVTSYAESQAYQACVEHHAPDECDHNN